MEGQEIRFRILELILKNTDTYTLDFGDDMNTDVDALISKVEKLYHFIINGQ